MRFLTSRSWLGVALLTLTAGTAMAFAPNEADRGLVVPRSDEMAPPVWRTMQSEGDRRPEVARFETRFGGTWFYQWNARTGTPHAVFGSGVQIASGPLEDEATVKRLARAFVDTNQDLLRVNPSQIHLRSIAHGLGKWGIVFDQLYAGLPVEGARLRLLVTDDGRLAFFGSDWYPGISISTQPAIGFQAARDLAALEVGFQAARDTDHGGELIILPVLDEGAYTYRLVWRVRLEIEEPYAIWESYVDARSGATLWRYDDVHYANVVGTAAGDIEDFGYCYGEQDRPVPHLRIQVDGGNSGYSNADGTFEIVHGGVDPVGVSCELVGRWVNVNNQLPPDGLIAEIAVPGEPIELRWNDGNSHDAERATYLHANRIHDMIKHYDPAWNPPDYQMPANVNINSSCNAFWNGNSINFYRAGGGCGNTGQMGDVVYHEYGHGLTQWIYGGNPNDVGEGNSDIAAMFIDGNSIVGEGFTLDQCDHGIRDADNDLRYPDDYQAGQIHFNGQIVSGFWWDAMEILRPMLGEEATIDLLWQNWHFGRRTLQPVSMPDQILTAFLMDDDNGDLTDGTPHYDAFCPAADHHGFTPPGPVPVVTIQHTRLHNQTYDGNPDVVTATITSSETAIDPGTVELNYQVNGGGILVVGMTPTGNPDEFAGAIPALPVGSVIDYAIVARDMNGNGGAYPPSYCTPEEPAGTERFYVANLVDEVEVDFGWSVDPDGDDTATTGVWERIDPNGTAAQPEDDQTPPPGVYAWVTGQCAPGCGLGDNDVDGGHTTLLSPFYDLTGSTNAKVIYYRWYSNDTGAEPGTDFWVVEASNNAGGNWATVEDTNVSDASWTPVEVDLNALFGEAPGQVLVRFVAADEEPGSLVEAGVDDFLLIVDYQTDAPDVGPGFEGPHFALRPAHPNPFGSGTEVSFEIPAAAPVRVAIHDVTGRLVRELANDTVFDAGGHVMRWDGTDGSGRPVSAGVYYVRLATPGFAASRAVVLQR